MATIINNQDFTLTPNQQQVINNAAANMGLDTVIIGEKDYDGEEVTCAVYFESTDNGDTVEEFAFNLNLETDKVFA